MARSASATIKGITIEIGGNTTKLIKALENVNKKSKDVQSELRGINSLLKFDPKNTELLKQKQTILAEAIENTNQKLEKLKEAEANVQKQVKEGKISQEQYRDFQREIIATEQDLQKLEKQMKSFGSVTKQQLQAVGNDFKTIGNNVQEAGKKLSKLSIIAGAGLIGMGKSAMDFESAFAGVEKTVNGTKEQLAELKQGIRNMAKEIPSSTTEIAAVAEAAGQLGIKTEDVLKFSKVMIDLGNSTNLSANDAASTLAKFSNIMGTAADNYERLGSTIVDLGNNFATTEADITNMAMRIAGAGKTIGLSEANVLSLATALSSVGIEAEMGGSAISKTMIKMATAVENGGKNLNEFAKVAGMTANEFKKCFEEDAVTAISKFIIGLGDTEKAGKSTLAMLNDLGFDEVRLRDTMLRAANASDVFTTAINTGNKAWEENNALTNEANKRYATTKSRMQISINKIKDLAISLGSKLLPIVQKGLAFLNKLADSFDNLSEGTQNTILVLTGLTAVASPTVTAIGKITTGVGTLITILSKLATPSGLIITTLGLLAGACVAASKDMNKLSEETQKNINETKKVIDKHKELDETLKNNKKIRDEAIKNAEIEAETTELLYKKLVDLEGVENKTNAQKEIMAELVNQLNEKMPELNLSYDKEKDALNKTTNAIKEQIEAQKDLLKAKAAQSQLSGIMEDIVKKELAIEEATKTNAKAQEDYNEAVKKRKELESEFNNNYFATFEDYENLKKAKKAEEELKKVLDESSESLEEQKKSLKNLNDEYSETQKYVENAYKNFDIKNKLADLESMAKKIGTSIPENLAKGMEEGSIAIPTKVDGLKKLIDFEDTLKSSGMYGQKIPYSLSEGLVNGKTTVEMAIKEMEAIVNFKNAEDKSRISGIEIPKNLQEGILNGELTVKEAVTRANNWIEFQKANKKAIDDGHTIPENLKNAILDGKLSIEEANTKMQSWIKFQDAINKAKAAGVDIAENLAQNVKDGKVKVEVATESLNNSVSKQLSSTKKMGVDAGGNLVEGIEVGTKDSNKRKSLFSAVGNLASGVLSKLKNALKIHSPSKATEEDARFLLEGLNVGVKKNKEKVFKNISEFGSDVLKSLNNELKDTDDINTEFNGNKNILMNVMTKANSNNNSSTTEEIKILATLLDKYMPEVINQLKEGKNVYLDSKKVGQSIAPEVNNQLGIISSKEQRGY